MKISERDVSALNRINSGAQQANLGDMISEIFDRLDKLEGKIAKLGKNAEPVVERKTSKRKIKDS